MKRENTVVIGVTSGIAAYRSIDLAKVEGVASWITVTFGLAV